MTTTGILWIAGVAVAIFLMTLLDRYLKYFFQVRLLKKKQEYKDKE